MLQFFKNLLRKPEPQATVRIPPRTVTASAPVPVSGIPQVEIASLSLATILQRFPPELKKGIARMPDPETMVALPLSTILKQLPGGAVKMSLASIYRQAPAGTFASDRVEEKRMVEVPLGEIFKRVKPELLKRRHDQRTSELAEDGIDVFGDKDNPYALAPSVVEERSRQSEPRFTLPAAAVVESAAEAELDLDPVSSYAPVLEPVKPLKMQEPMIAAPPPGVPAGLKPPPLEPIKLAPSPSMAPPPAVARADVSPAEKAPAASPVPPSPPAAGDRPAPTPVAFPTANFDIGLKEICGNWPEPVRAELGAMDGAQVTLPATEVGAGLAKGKISFTWGQLRTWITPPLNGESAVAANTELQLPLRAIAPAFLKASKQGKDRKSVSIDDTIPALFAPSADRPAAPPPAPAAAPQSSASAPVQAPKSAAPNGSIPAPAAVSAPPTAPPKPEKPAPPATSETKGTKSTLADTPAPQRAESNPGPRPAATPPATTAPPANRGAETVPATAKPATLPVVEEKAKAAAPAPSFKPTTTSPAAPTPAAPTHAPAAPPTSAPSAAAVAAATAALAGEEKAPSHLGEVFGQPNKRNWSPGEIVENCVKLPTVAGAIVALQEGLVVTHKLPEGMKGEVVAAFLPQIFGRLNQYATEMKLGDIEEVLLSTRGAHFHAFRAGQVFFAVLGKKGKSMPAQALRLMATELVTQTKQ